MSRGASVRNGVDADERPLDSDGVRSRCTSGISNGIGSCLGGSKVDPRLLFSPLAEGGKYCSGVRAPDGGSERSRSFRGEEPFAASSSG